MPSGLFCFGGTELEMTCPGPCEAPLKTETFGSNSNAAQIVKDKTKRSVKL
jgi:hypothetical protein